ncbi:MAG: glycerol-3-phosphate 1-O-acyltransferase PlsY [Dehalococcoidia bacterium]|nr:MAG: glycerol-3-phosphate 1-O-acyltransferase PlsY [Dehalococcoidia bacterium]
MIALEFIGVIILGYFIGAIPFGVVIGRLTRGIDVRDYGSGSMGMANVLRTVGARAGVLVFLADLAKGAAAVAFAWLIFASLPAMVAWGQVAGGVAAVIGHSWPVYVGFRGGRGVTTGFGALLMIAWPVGLICFAIFLIVVALSRYVSLGSMLAGVSVLVVMISFVLLNLEPFAYLVYGLIVAPLIIFRHRGNIQRLLSGTEPKIGQKTEVS